MFTHHLSYLGSSNYGLRLFHKAEALISHVNIRVESDFVLIDAGALWHFQPQVVGGNVEHLSAGPLEFDRTLANAHLAQILLNRS